MVAAVEPKDQDLLTLPHAPIDLPGRMVVGKKIIQRNGATGRGGRVIYKYVKVTPPPEGVSLEDHIHSLSLAEAHAAEADASTQTAPTTRVAVYSEADAQAYMHAKAEQEAQLLEAAHGTTPAPSSSTASAAASSSPSSPPSSSASGANNNNNNGVQVNNLMNAPKGSASGSIIQGTVQPEPLPPPKKETGFVAFWTDKLEFSQTAAALVFMASIIIGMALGATIRSYINEKEAIEAITNKYQAFTVE